MRFSTIIIRDCVEFYIDLGDSLRMTQFCYDYINQKIWGDYHGFKYFL